MIISTIVIQITEQLDCWEHVTDAHVKMLIHAHWKATETYFAIAAPTMLVTDAPVSSQYNHQF